MKRARTGSTARNNESRALAGLGGDCAAAASGAARKTDV